MLRLRLRYEKEGPIRFASHRDLMRVFRRSLASAEIPVSFSQGFNPHPRFSFGPSLRTGWESRDEYMDLAVDSPADRIVERCNLHLPGGLRLIDSMAVDPSVPKLAADITAARYEVRLAESDVFEPGRGTPKVLLDRISERAAVDGSTWRARVLEALTDEVMGRFGARPQSGSGEPPAETPSPTIIEVRSAQTDGGTDTPVMIEYFSTMHGGKSLFPEDILTPFLGEPANYMTPIRVVRKALYVERGGRYVSPLSRAALETRR